jgi:hypothetical protein
MKLKKAIAARRKRVTKKVAGMIKAGTKKLKQAERSGALTKWKGRAELGLKALEVVAVVAAARKGARKGTKLQVRRVARKRAKS